MRDYLWCKSKLGWKIFWCKIPWVPPLKYLRNVVSRIHPPQMKNWTGIGTFEFWVVKNTPLRMCGVETNRCIPYGYRLVCFKVKWLQDSYHKNVPRYTVLTGIRLGRTRTVRIPDPMRSSSGSAHTCHSAVQSHSASRDTDPSGYRSHQLLCRCRVSYKRTLWGKGISKIISWFSI